MESMQEVVDPMDVPGAARCLGVSTSWVYKKVEARELPHFRVGRSIRFTKRALLEFIENNTVGPDRE